MADRKLNIKLGVILGGGGTDDDYDDESLQEVDMHKAPESCSMAGVSRIVSTVKRVKRCASEKADVDVCADGLNAIRMIGNRVRKLIFTDKVTKIAIEFLLRYVGEYEEQMMRMIAKNERLTERILESEKLFAQRNVSGMGVSYASMAGKDVTEVAGSNQVTFVVVVKAKNDSVKMTSEEGKEKEMKNESGDLNIHMRAVRKTRGGGLTIE